MGTSWVLWERRENWEGPMRTLWELGRFPGNLWKLMGTCGNFVVRWKHCENFVGISWELEGFHGNVVRTWRVPWELVGIAWVPWKLVGI